MLAALAALRRAGGGALIAVVCSVEALVSLPMHAACCASEHAVGWRSTRCGGSCGPSGRPSRSPASSRGPSTRRFFAIARIKMDVAPEGPPPWDQPSVVAD